jgi:hypothetical protein
MTGTARTFLLICLVALTVAACGGDDDPEPTATSGPAPTPEANDPTTIASTGSTASDGVCQVTIPDDWVDVGTGRGTTPQRDRWSLFGGSIASDAAWTSAKELLRSQMSSAPDAEIVEEGDRVVVTTPDGRRYLVRQRFENRYCELSLTATRDVSEAEQAVWQAVAASLAPVAPD